jgi:23S rRNA (cytidine1920-2'-O)/16S rRNA (cytidine1409-2'-O)-methyltransferase
VLVMERLNARYLGDSSLPFRPELITVDVSFISLAMLMAPIVATAADEFDLLGLVKPQFELGKEKVGKGGVVRDAADRREAIRKVVEAAQEEGLTVRGLASSGLPGPKGNRETFVWAARSGDPVDVEAALKEVEP